MIESTYRVDIEQFSGPLDLLLHLLRQEELEVGEIQVAAVCDRYLAYLDDLDRIDIDAAGEFLVMASTLMRLKSRSLLPSDEVALEDDDLDPRFELVRQLIEYRKFKRVAGFLDERREFAEQLFDRGMRPEMDELRDQPKVLTDTAGATVDTLFAAFARLLQETRATRTYVVTKDDTPMEEHLARLRAQLQPGERVAFRLLFPEDATRGYVVGVFLALLEMMKLGEVIVIQDEEFGAIDVEGRDPEERRRLVAEAEAQRARRAELERLQAEQAAAAAATADASQDGDDPDEDADENDEVGTSDDPETDPAVPAE